MASESPKTEQIITEFFAKTLHIILQSRSLFLNSGDHLLVSSSVRPRDKWFNLALRECPAALENLHLWRHTSLDPVVVDVVQVPDRGTFPREGEARNETIIERWIVQYETRNTQDSKKLSKRGGSTSSQSVYKKSIILLRSLYLTLRLLPAHPLYRHLDSSARVHAFGLAHRVSSFVEPFTHREEAEMHRYTFTPVETACGRLCICVLYSPTLSDVSFVSSTPMSPRFIPDYFGSPLTNPLMRFPSIPQGGLDSQGSPSVPFSRRHSGSYDALRNFPPPVPPSHSPTFSDSRANSSKMNSKPVCSPHKSNQNPNSVNAYLAYKNEHLETPIFSPSASSNHISKALLRTESAPVRKLPTSNLGNGSAFPSSHGPPLSGGAKLDSSTNTDNTKAPTERRDVPSDTTTHKTNPLGKKEVGNLSGAKLSSHNSLRISCSRSFGKFSFQNVFDESEFCPFAVDDTDTTNAHIRTGSFDEKGHVSQLLHRVGSLPVRKSQDASVGSLVHILKTTLPLHKDLSNSTILQASKSAISNQNIQEHEHANSKAGVVQNPTSNIGITSSGRLMLKTTSEALEELKGYRDMKEKLLKQGSNVSRSVATGGM